MYTQTHTRARVCVYFLRVLVEFGTIHPSYSNPTSVVFVGALSVRGRQRKFDVIANFIPAQKHTGANFLQITAVYFLLIDSLGTSLPRTYPKAPKVPLLRHSDVCGLFAPSRGDESGELKIYGV